MPTTKRLQELIIAVHFDAPIAFTVVDLADWVTHFSQQFPVVQQLPSLPAMGLPVAGGPQMMQFQMLTTENMPLPRMLLRSAEGRHSIQLQNDRFAFGWHRTEPLGEPAEYAGFEAHGQAWADLLASFEAWTQTRFRVRPNHRLVELTYSNAAPLERQGKKKRLSEIFTFVQPGSRVLNGFSTNWVENVYPKSTAGPDPKAIVSAQVAIGSAPPAQAVLAFTFSGIGAVAQGEESKHILNDLHAKITEMYESSIAADAD
jgi:uncharacterized protein (TIGR04255 family)